MLGAWYSSVQQQGAMGTVPGSQHPFSMQSNWEPYLKYWVSVPLGIQNGESRILSEICTWHISMVQVWLLYYIYFNKYLTGCKGL